MSGWDEWGGTSGWGATVSERRAPPKQMPHTWGMDRFPPWWKGEAHRRMLIVSSMSATIVVLLLLFLLHLALSVSNTVCRCSSTCVSLTLSRRLQRHPH